MKQAHLQENTREATTFTVALSMDRGPLDMQVQIVHAGKTDAVLLEQPWLEHTHHVTSENGWATTTTIRAALVCAWCTALDHAESFQKYTTIIISHRLSVVSLVHCPVCPGTHPCFHVLTTCPRHPDSDIRTFFWRWLQKVLTQGDFCAVP